MNAATDRFEVRALKPLIGAIVGSDKQTLLSGRYSQRIREMLEDRGGDRVFQNRFHR